MNRIYKAMKFFNFEGLHELLARNGVIQDGKKPLFWAAETGNLPITQYLVEHGADPNGLDHLGNHPVDYARKKDVVDFLNKAMQ